MIGKPTYEKLLLLTLIGVGLAVLVKTNFYTPVLNQQFVDLAASFLSGKLHFLPSARSIYDTSVFQGNYFWPLGPFPAVLLMPFVAFFGGSFQQSFLQIPLILLIGFLSYKIAFKILNNKIHSLWLSIGFVFSTAFIGVATVPHSWQFAQIVATFLMVAAIDEYVYQRRWIYIGIFVALAIAVRSDLILAVIFFGGNILISKKHIREKIIHASQLLVPLGVCMLFLLAYNYFRFGNIFDQGYTFQNLADPFLSANRAQGVWGLIHFPANLYYFFFKGPDGVFIPGTQILTYPFLRENSWGMSIFFTSPIFLWALRAPFSKKEVKLAALTTLFIAFAIFGYYGIGYDQYGYRYALDFYPFLFLILLYALQKHVSLFFKIVLTLSFIFNLFLIITP